MSTYFIFSTKGVNALIPYSCTYVARQRNESRNIEHTVRSVKHRAQPPHCSHPASTSSNCPPGHNECKVSLRFSLACATKNRQIGSRSWGATTGMSGCEQQAARQTTAKRFESLTLEMAQLSRFKTGDGTGAAPCMGHLTPVCLVADPFEHSMRVPHPFELNACFVL